MCRLLAPNQLTALAAKANATAVRKAEDILFEARTTIAACGLESKEEAKIKGRLDCRIVAFLLKKTKELPGSAEFKTLDEISQARCVVAL